jgi:hypothetical protein
MLELAELSGLERRLWDAAREGRRISAPVGDDIGAADPGRGFEWGPERTVRAAVLVELPTNAQRSDGHRPRAVRLELARVNGMLDLEDHDLLCPLALRACFLDEPVRLGSANARSIALVGCHLPELRADQVTTVGSLNLENSNVGGVALRKRVLVASYDCRGPSSTVGQVAPWWPTEHASMATCCVASPSAWMASCGYQALASGVSSASAGRN